MHAHPKGTGSTPPSAHKHANGPKGAMSPEVKAPPTPEVERAEQRRGSASSSSSNNINRRPSLLSNLYNTTTSSSRAKMSSTVCNMEYGAYQAERQNTLNNNNGVRRGSTRSRGESEHVHVPVQGPRVINGGRRDSKESQRLILAEAARLKEIDRLKQSEIDSCFEWVKRASELMQQLPPPNPVTAPSLPLPLPLPLSLEEKLLSAEDLYAKQDSVLDATARMENIRNINAAASFMRSQIGSKVHEDSHYENLARSRSMDSSGQKRTPTSAEKALGRAGGENTVQEKGIAKVEEGDADPSRAVQLEAIIKFFRSQSEVQPGQPVTYPPFPFTFPATPVPADTPSVSAEPMRRPSRIPGKGLSTPPKIQPVVPHTTSGPVPVTQCASEASLPLPRPPSESQPFSVDKVHTSVIPPPRSPSPSFPPPSPQSHLKPHRVLHPSALPFPRSPRSLPRPTQPHSPSVSQIVRAGSLPPPSPYSLPPAYSSSQSPQSPSEAFKSVPEFETIYAENPMYAMGNSQVRNFYKKERLAPAAADVDMSESELISLLSTYDSLPLSQLAAVVRGIMSDSPHASKKPIPVSPNDVPTPHTAHVPKPHSSPPPRSDTDLPILTSDCIKTPPPIPPQNRAPAPVPVLARPSTPERRSRLSINTDVRRDAGTTGPGTAPPVVEVAKVEKRTFHKQLKKERKAEKERLKKEEEERIALELEIEREKERKEANRRVWSFTGKKSDIWDGKVDSAPFIVGDIDSNKPKDKKPFLKRTVNPLLKAPHGSPNPILKSPVLERRAFKGGDTVPVVKTPLILGEVHLSESPDCSLFRPSWNDDTHVEPLSVPFPPALRVSKSPPRRDLGDTPPRSNDASSATTPVKSGSTNSSVTRTDPGSETRTEEDDKHAQLLNKRKEELEMKLKLKIDELDVVVKSWNESLVSGDYGDVGGGNLDGISVNSSVVDTSCCDSGLSDTYTANGSTDNSKRDLKSSGSGSRKEKEVVKKATEVVKKETVVVKKEVKKHVEVVKKEAEVVQPVKDLGLSLREKLQMKLLDCEEKEKEKEKEEEKGKKGMEKDIVVVKEEKGKEKEKDLKATKAYVEVL